MMWFFPTLVAPGSTSFVMTFSPLIELYLNSRDDPNYLGRGQVLQ